MKDEKTNGAARPFAEDEDRELFDSLYSVVSSGECTGLIPAAPVSEEEIDGYSDIYDIPLSQKPTSECNHLHDCGSVDSAPS